MIDITERLLGKLSLLRKLSFGAEGDTLDTGVRKAENLIWQPAKICKTNFTSHLGEAIGPQQFGYAYNACQ